MKFQTLNPIYVHVVNNTVLVSIALEGEGGTTPTSS